MKDLCTKKKYDLSQLNDEQLQAVLDWLKENDTGWDTCHIDKLKSSFCVLYNHHGEWKLQTSKGNETNALDLFEERLSNVKVDLKTPSDLTNDQIEALMSMLKKELPNITFTQDETIYDDMLSLIEKGKQHGLKIVVTFEKL